MDNNKSEQMQNWKKLLIMDPLLNYLFNDSINIKDFIHQKILVLEHDQIVHTFSKLSSVKHALSKRLQKQVEFKHQIIQKTFKQQHQINVELKLNNEAEIYKNLKILEIYNKNYLKVQKNTIKLENVNKILKFAKALQKLKINCRLLKTFMKDYSNNNTNQKQYNKTDLNQSSLNLPKISKLLKQINDLTIKNDFTGINFYQNEKQNIKNAKIILFTLSQKQLTKRIQKYQQFLKQYLRNPESTLNKNLTEKIKFHQDDIIQKIKILQLINQFKQYIGRVYKKSLMQISQNLKYLFSKQSLEQFRDYFLIKISQQILIKSLFHIRMEEICHTMRISNEFAIGGIPNMFLKYIQKIRDYFRQLIKWNMEQNTKQNQKKYLNQNKNLSNSIFQNIYLNQMQDLSSKNDSMSLKCSLIFKYPTLLVLLSHLLNRLHQQVFIHAQYNLNKYSFTQKKQEIIFTLEPLSRKFYQIIVSLTKINQNLFKTEDFIKRTNLIKFIHEKLFNNELKENQKRSELLAPLIQQLNEKLIKCIEIVIQKNNFKEIISQITKMIQVCTEPTLLKSYSSLQTVVNHISRLKLIQKKVNLQNEAIEPKQ